MPKANLTLKIDIIPNQSERSNAIWSWIQERGGREGTFGLAFRSRVNTPLARYFALSLHSL